MEDDVRPDLGHQPEDCLAIAHGGDDALAIKCGVVFMQFAVDGVEGILAVVEHDHAARHEACHLAHDFGSDASASAGD